MGVPRRQRMRRRAQAGPQLAGLTLSGASLGENAAAGTPVGAVLGRTAGSTLALVDDAGGRFALSGASVVAGAVATDHESAASHAITLRETLAGYANSPRDSVLTIAIADSDETSATFLTADDGDRLVDDISNPLILEAA